MAIVTISGGSPEGARQVAQQVAERLGFLYLDEERLRSVGEQEYELSSQVFSQNRAAAAFLLADLALTNDLVVVELSARELFAELTSALHVSLGSSSDSFHLTVALERLGLECAVQTVAAAARTAPLLERDTYGQLERIRNGHRASLAAPLPERPIKQLPHFAHTSEREFARVMDFYRIRWEYEPRTFPIEWNQEGHVVESFTPDFYLPDLDLHIELTTMKQSLVTKKNRKVRRLKELYPDLNIKIFYERDYRSLVEKYGLQRIEKQEPASP
ncbi:MAG: hypothetical protein HY652_01295 [Acidobacteria bacterium]|nr:hypothetical protein [Acidobacteriota bacterium]